LFQQVDDSDTGFDAQDFDRLIGCLPGSPTTGSMRSQGKVNFFSSLNWDRPMVMALCKLIGYRLDTPVAATTTLRFSLSAPMGTDLIVPARTACRALLGDGQADFETVEDGLIPRGGLR
jgi:hypothetical protein